MRRRARALLGTLVEVAAAGGEAVAGGAIDAAIDAAFGAVADVQAALSRFEPGSEIARFNALPAGGAIDVGAHAQAVLGAAVRLAAASRGRFDVALGSGRWQLEGPTLRKLDAATRLDLGGIAKGHAVDRAVAALQAAGCAGGSVNAGGDLRCFGTLGSTLWLRDEAAGTVRGEPVGALRPLGTLHDGAFATSRFGAGARSALAGRARACHVSVLAPECLWADALTKLVALGADDRLLAAFGARARVHGRRSRWAQ